MKIILESSAVTIRINGHTIEITGDELVNLKEDKPIERAVREALAAPQPKAHGKQGGKPSKAVQVKFGDEWKTFATITEAAKQLGGTANGLCTALKNGGTFHGHEVRRAKPDLDACLKEIEESNKRPYEPTRR